MDLSKHCQLCDNQQFDFQTGTICGLTQQKPNFHVTCPLIKLDKNLEEKIKQIHVEYELIKSTKLITMSNFVFFLLISIGLMIGGYLLGIYLFNKGVVLSKAPLIIFGVGVLTLPLAFGPLNKYRQSMGVAKKKKDDLEKLMEMYHVKYEIEVKIKKDVHGNKHVETTLNIF